LAKANKAVSLGISALIVFVLILVVGFGVFLNSTFNTTQTSSITPATTTISSSNSSSTATSATTISYSESQQNLNSTSGLRLDLLVAPSIGTAGTFVISVDEFNTLNTPNNASTTYQWKYSADSLSPYNDCGASGPLGFAIFQGYYDLSNYTNGRALPLYNTTYAVTCTSTILPATHYVFNPQSEIATAYNARGPVSPLETNTSVSLSFTTKGYFTGGQYLGTGASFHGFSPGTYTVLAADEWGKVVLVHFTISLGLQDPVQVISVIGPIPPYNPGGPVISVTLENVAEIPIISLTATLKLPSAEPLVPYSFSFSVDSSNPLLQGQSVESTLTAIGAGSESNATYPLVISGMFSNGLVFNFTQQVMIVQPS
jgi:hypothetical protein